MKTFKSKFLFFYAVIWMLVFLGPFLRNLDNNDPGGLTRMIGDWTNLLLLFIVFLINLGVLVPKLLFNNKRSQYAVIVIVMIVSVSIVDIFIHQGNRPHDNPPMHPENPFAIHAILGSIFNNLLTAILIIGSSTAFELFAKWTAEQEIRKEIENVQLKTNLALLRNQVSPHFFMNTLNNIHSLIEMDTHKAQDAVERLSTLMRYLLYDSARNIIELRKEIEFIHSFVALMQLRHSDEVEVTMLIPEQIPDIQIPPMLFISLIENAFKYGVSYPSKSYIWFELKTTNESLHCIIKNSKHKKTPQNQGEYSGIGLNNIKESLKLIYGDTYSLDIADKTTEFEVNLIIPL
jgi:multisubunit Na+/H+ antiporter MnhC subunit